MFKNTKTHNIEIFATWRRDFRNFFTYHEKGHHSNVVALLFIRDL